MMVHHSLLISLHDVTPWSIDEVQHILKRLRRIGVEKFSLLVVPYYHERGLISSHPKFIGWLKDLERDGCEIILHGWTHLEKSPNRTLRCRFGTDGEGEFAVLDREEAVKRLKCGMDVMSELGFRLRGFVPPAWFSSPASVAATRELGFSFMEDHLSIRCFQGNRRIWSPAVSYSQRTPLRTALSLGFNALLARALDYFSIARVAIHPSDVRNRRVFGQIERLLARLVNRAEIRTYSEALEL